MTSPRTEPGKPQLELVRWKREQVGTAYRQEEAGGGVGGSRRGGTASWRVAPSSEAPRRSAPGREITLRDDALTGAVCSGEKWEKPDWSGAKNGWGSN